MSSSVAPSARAWRASATLISVVWLPWGKPIVVPTLTSVPSRIAAARFTSAGRTQTDATSYFAARRQPLRHVRVVQLGPEEAVVDRLGDVALGEAGDVEGHVAPVSEPGPHPICVGLARAR